MFNIFGCISKKEEIDQRLGKCKEEVKKYEITFNQEPPLVQPVIVKKGIVELGKIWIEAGEYKFRPNPRIQFPYSQNEFYLDYTEEDLLLIYNKVRSLNLGQPL